jgi:hypothetical protein
VYEVLPPSSVTGRVRIVGYLLPASFRVEGLPYALDYDVGYVVDGDRKRWAVTRFVAGTVVDPVATLREPARAGVDVERVTDAALVRLAMRASIVYGYAYEPGSVIDSRTHEIVGKVAVGDRMPDGVPVLGVRVERDGRVAALDRLPVSLLLYREGDDVDDADVRLFRGQRPSGRQRGLPISDADLRLIARLYDEAYDDPTVVDVPDTVRVRLIAATNGRLAYSESWIRKQGVAARKRGLLRQGKRHKKRGKR